MKNYGLCVDWTEAVTKETVLFKVVKNILRKEVTTTTDKLGEVDVTVKNKDLQIFYHIMEELGCSNSCDYPDEGIVVKFKKSVKNSVKSRLKCCGKKGHKNDERTENSSSSLELMEEKFDYKYILNQRDSHGKSALDLALSSKNSVYSETISDCLEKAGANLVDKNSHTYTEPVCVVCMDNPSQIVFYPCLHVSICERCFEQGKLTSCTNCREEIVRTVNVNTIE